MQSRILAPVVALTALLAFAVPSASESLIGVFFNTDATDCDATVPINSPVTWYLCAVLSGDALAAGMSGAEFRQTGTPATWFATSTPNPAANVHLGDPLGAGAIIAFPSCQGTQTGVVLLYTVNGFAPTQVTDAVLRIEQHSTPNNPNFQCPSMINCGPPPLFTRFCVCGTAAIINRQFSLVCFPDAPACPTVGTEARGWSALKSLYRD